MPLLINIKFSQEENFQESFDWDRETFNAIYRKTSNLINFVFTSIVMVKIRLTKGFSTWW